jgi:hypothetical protein
MEPKSFVDAADHHRRARDNSVMRVMCIVMRAVFG